MGLGYSRESTVLRVQQAAFSLWLNEEGRKEKKYESDPCALSCRFYSNFPSPAGS